MRAILKIATLLMAAGILLPAAAQQNRQGKPAKGSKTDPKSAAAQKKANSVRVTFSGVLPDSVIRKSVLDSIANFRLVADGGGRVEHFNFSYTERNLYEDSVGNLMIIAEPLSELVMGDTLPVYLRDFLSSHGKAGDTAWIEAIKVRDANGAIKDGATIKMQIAK